MPVNGWTIKEIEPGWEYRYRVIRGNFEWKTYTYDAAVKYAEQHP